MQRSGLRRVLSAAGLILIINDLIYVTSSLPSVTALSGLQGEVDLGAPGQREQDFRDVEFSSLGATGSQEQQQENTPEAEFCHQGSVSFT